MDKELRKKLASYYTKPSFSELICSLLLTSPNAIILDPSCGSGNLLNSAYNKISNLQKEGKDFTLIVGVEIYNDAWKEAKKLENKSDSKISITVLNGDAFFLLDDIKDLLSNRISNNSFLKEPNEFVILANPPFSKSQNLELNYKRSISEVLKLNTFISMGLHCYFLNLIYQLLPNKGKFGLILPITISYANRGVELIKNFFLNSKIRYIFISEAETAFSIDSNFQEIVIIGNKNEFESNIENKVIVLTLKTKLTNQIVQNIVKAIRIYDNIEKNSSFSGYTILQKELLSKIGLQGWNFLYRSENLNHFINDISKLLVPLNLEKKIVKKRGINVPTDFFFLPNKYYVIERNNKQEITLKLRDKYQKKDNQAFDSIKIPKTLLVPLIRKPKYYKTTIIIPEEELIKNYCLILQENYLNQDVLTYLQFGEINAVHKRSNMSILGDKWYFASKTYVGSGNLFLTFKWDPRYRSFLVNYSLNPKIIAGQAFWTLSLLDKDTDLVNFFLAWINSTLSMGIIYGLADVQRRVWRQLAGNRINSLLIIPFNHLKNLSKEDVRIITKFNYKQFDVSLYKEIEYALKTLDSVLYNERVQVDLLFLRILTTFPSKELVKELKSYYLELMEELSRITNI